MNHETVECETLPIAVGPYFHGAMQEAIQHSTSTNPIAQWFGNVLERLGEGEHAPSHQTGRYDIYAIEQGQGLSGDEIESNAYQAGAMAAAFNDANYAMGVPQRDLQQVDFSDDSQRQSFAAGINDTVELGMETLFLR